MLTQEISDFIRLHREKDVRKLALIKGSLPKDQLIFALQQIEGWQIASKKVPSWANVSTVLYPPHLSLEQCSSELTARYKASLLSGGDRYVDLTGGMGVDFSFMSQRFTSAWYVEQNRHLCELAEHNFKELNIGNVSVCCSTTQDFVRKNETFDEIYLDPARRDTKGRKMVSISDCEPNLLELKPILLELCPSIWVKYSPMLDISLAIKELQTVDQVHIVSVANECKELLFHVSKEVVRSPKIFCVNIKKGKEECFEYQYEDEAEFPMKLADELCTYLYEPNASIMKAGAFKILMKEYNIRKLAVSSHLYTSDEVIPEFPGRKFKVESQFTTNKTQLSAFLKDCIQANITVRNYPINADDLRKKLKLKDGGEVYLFATTIGNQKILIKTKAIEHII